MAQNLQRVPMPLVAAAATLLLQVSCTDLTDLFDGEGLDALRLKFLADGYTWLALAEGRLETGSWSPVVASHNAPFGLETHLTRPFAEVVALLAWPFGMFLSPKDAALLAGMLSGPVLQIVTAMCLAWGAGAVMGRAGTLLAVAMFLVGWDLTFRTSFGVYAYDHHALHLCLEVAVLALLVRHASGAGRYGQMAGVAGMVAGAGVWAGMEMLIPAGIGGLALGLAWVLWGGDRRVRGLWLYALAMAVAMAAGLMVERLPANPLSLELDRLSTAHVLMGAVLVLAASAVVLTQRHWPRLGAVPRGTAASVSAAAAGMGLWVLIPDFFGGPYAAVDEPMQEFLAGLPWDRGAASMFAATPGLSGYYVFPWILAVASAAQGLRGRYREAYLVLLVGLFAAAVFPFWRARLIRHYILFTFIPLGAFGATLGWRLWNRSFTGLRAVALRAGAAYAVAAVMLSPFLGSITADLIFRQQATGAFWESVAHHGASDWASLGNALARVPRLGTGTIVTNPHHGAKVAYLSGLGGIATGCHCNEEGLADTLAILLSPPDASRTVAEKRGVEFVLLWPAARGPHGHDWFIERSGPDGLYARLAGGEPPDWLTPVPAAEIDVDGFVVYRTTFASSGSLNPGPSPCK